MDAIREYILSVTASAVLCGIVTALIGKKGMPGTAMKLLCGIFMALTVVGPWVDIRLDGLLELSSEAAQSADAYAASGENSAAAAMADIIKEQTTAYILDKAEALGVQLTVEVALSSDDIPVPTAVCLYGNVSPYAKKVLTERLEEDLGIPSEEQTWISQS